MPTFLPALLGLHLPRLLTACGMAIYHTHFTDWMAEAQKEEGIPLSHTACQQRSWDLNHPPWSLFTWMICQYGGNKSSCKQEGQTIITSFLEGSGRKVPPW